MSPITCAPCDAAVKYLVSPEALEFLHELFVKFEPRVRALLAARAVRQQQYDAGALPDFDARTAHIREGKWVAASLPADLLDRRVELTGPADDAKLVIGALNSGANVFMADFEDSLSPTWANVLRGQHNLFQAVRRTLVHTEAAAAGGSGKRYALGEKLATLFVRPRGWHLVEANCMVQGTPMPAALLDFGLFVFHNAAVGGGLYFYLPKMEHHSEARVWADVFRFAEARLGIANGRIRVTMLIETLPAAFCMDEMLWELREHVAGLNCGRWDYIFSYIKVLRAHRDRVLPDRNTVTMTAPFLRAYVLLLVQTCHRRGVHAMGGMSAYIPVKGDAAANAEALRQIRADKEREAGDGHDGTWVAHPALIALAREVFDAHMPSPNQIAQPRPDVRVTAADLLAAPPGPRTAAQLALNVRVTLHYLCAFLAGRGAVALYRLMEDAATAEISRAQLWQWMNTGVVVGDAPLTTARLAAVIAEEAPRVASELGRAAAAAHMELAKLLLTDMTTAPLLPDFLTSVCYPLLPFTAASRAAPSPTPTTKSEASKL